jgi:hypothetical protein
MTIGDPRQRFFNQAIFTSPTWFIQQCPICQGKAKFQQPMSLTWKDCTFCWGVGAVKVSCFSGQVEAIEPPEEPYWHKERSEATPPPGRADGGRPA